MGILISEKGLPFVLFVLGVLSAWWQLSWMPEAGVGKGFEMIAVARSLAEGRGFGDPFAAGQTGATAHAAPIYPLWLAAWAKALGYTPAFAVAVTLATMALHGLTLALLPALSRKWMGDERPGTWAAASQIALPLMPVLPQCEAAATAAGLVLFFRFAGRRQEPDGVAAGLLLLLNPATLFLMVARRLNLRFVAAMVLVCVPWTVRNYREFGRVFFIRDNLGLELFVSNNDLAAPTMAANGPSLKAYHPNFGADAVEAVRSKGEAVFASECLGKAVAWMREHPGRSLELTVQRVALFWFPESASRPAHSVSLWVVTGISLFGLARLPRAVVAGMVLYSLPYYLIQADPRYRYPLLWITLLGCGVALEDLRARLRGKVRASG